MGYREHLNMREKWREIREQEKVVWMCECASLPDALEACQHLLPKPWPVHYHIMCSLEYPILDLTSPLNQRRKSIIAESRVSTQYSYLTTGTSFKRQKNTK